jgi:hypothetical protein
LGCLVLPSTPIATPAPRNNWLTDYSTVQRIGNAISACHDEKQEVKVYAAPRVRDEIVQFCIQERRFINTMRLDTGEYAIEFFGAPVVVDRTMSGRAFRFEAA